MADYRTLQEAINAGITNMTEDTRGSTYNTYNYFGLSPGLFRIGYHNVNEAGVSRYGSIEFDRGDPTECSIYVGYRSSSASGYFDKEYYETGTINGNKFFKYLCQGSPSLTMFIFETNQVYLSFKNSGPGSIYKLLSAEQEITYDYTQPDILFTAEDTVNGIDWVLSYDKPDLPVPVPIPPAPTPTIKFTFVNGKKYRARIITKYKKLNEEKEVYSNYCDEFIGHKIPQRYTFVYGGSIDLSDMSVWDTKYTNRQGILALEGDYKGLHYKYYNNSEGNQITCVITGKQTEKIDSFNEFPFNDTSVNPAYDYPATWAYNLFIDAEILDLNGWFIVTGSRFFEPPSEVVFGPNAVLPPLTGRLTGSLSGVYGGFFYLDNLSQSDFIIDIANIGSYDIFRRAYIQSDDDIGSRTLNFLRNIKFSSSVQDISALFDSVSYMKKIDTSEWVIENPVSMAGIFRSCGDLEGTIDLRGLRINGSMSEAFSSCKIDEVIFSSSGNAVSLLTYAFRNCSKVKKIDLSSFTVASGYTSYGVYAKDAFYDCSSLEELDMRNLKIRCNSTSSSYDARNMLYNCTSLKRFVTPSFYGNYRPTLPVAMYDEDDPTDIYEAGETVPANTTLIAVNQ